MFRRTLFSILAIVVLSCVSQSCSYRLDAASIPPALKTINVEFFENNAPFVVNNLSQNFTEALKTKIRSQTRLSIVRGEANATMSGAIVGYSIAPVSVQATNTTTAPPIASASRLTITVNVKYVNDVDKKLNFEQSFSQYANFTGDIGTQEQAIIATILPKLTEDIFNKAFANW
ncbi:LptE family protein [Mucilaginibacter jinjuensis]|uniref:LptE family protein n=1 Tax=Mucilaginibacter jinjuensis TaxID=1176721 RepID=A0ABY7T929_9SPHI|nr:LptE family protein [Mucilaginibacter jinjuensis]WCT12851.1 LptE family protein [Mucilaginibacter jinjuensis]